MWASSGRLCGRVSRPKGYWNDVKNQRLFLDGIARELGIIRNGDWKYVGTRQIEKLGGGPMLRLYPSYYQAIQCIFPELEWNEFEFSRLPRNYFEKLENQKRCLDHVCAKLGLASPLELMYISATDIRKHGKWMKMN